MNGDLPDYSGSFFPDLQYQDFSKDVLIRLLGEYSRIYVAMDGFYHSFLTDKFGLEEAGRVGAEMWLKAGRLSLRRLREVLDIGGNDVETLFKWLQVDPAFSAGVYQRSLELKNRNHGIITVTKCPSLEYFERKGDGREVTICQGEETDLFIGWAKMVNPAIEVKCLKIPPRKSRDDVACQWEYRLPADTC